MRGRPSSAIAPESPFYLLFGTICTGVSFFAKDCQFRLMCANRNFYSRFGFSTEKEIVGRDDFSIFPPRLANFRKDDEEVLRTGKPKLGIVELFFSRQGIPDWFVTNKLPVRDRQGRVIGLMGSTQSHEGNKQVLQPYLQIDRAVEWIRAHFREPITVRQLAAMVHLLAAAFAPEIRPGLWEQPADVHHEVAHQAACEGAGAGQLPAQPARGNTRIFRSEQLLATLSAALGGDAAEVSPADPSSGRRLGGTKADRSWTVRTLVAVTGEIGVSCTAWLDLFSIFLRVQG